MSLTFKLLKQKQSVATQELEPTPFQSPESLSPAACLLTREEPDLTWEDKVDDENNQPNTSAPTETDEEYQRNKGGDSKF